jgi:hypothetical protein
VCGMRVMVALLRLPAVSLLFAANGTQQTRSDILRLVEAGTAIFEDDNPAVRVGKSDEEWSIKFVGQLSMKDDGKITAMQGQRWLWRISDEQRRPDV